VTKTKRRIQLNKEEGLNNQRLLAQLQLQKRSKKKEKVVVAIQAVELRQAQLLIVIQAVGAVAAAHLAVKRKD
jgi:hypothetical protein